MDQEEDIKLITRFFDLDLSEEELAAFEMRMSQDPAFLNKVDIYKKATSIVADEFKDKKEQSRIGKWENLLDKQEQTKRSNKISWKWIGSIAAGLAIVFFIWKGSEMFQQPQMDQLIAASWDKNVGLGYYTNRSDAQSPSQEKMVKAYLAYTNKEYNTAIDLLQNFNDDEKYYEDALLIKALAIHKIGDSKKALNLLNTLTNNTTSNIAKTANWYTGLIHLDLGDHTAAEKFLELPNDANSQIRLKEQ